MQWLKYANYYNAQEMMTYYYSILVGRIYMEVLKLLLIFQPGCENTHHNRANFHNIDVRP